MPTTNGRRKTAPKKTKRFVPAPQGPLVLTAEEVANLKNRYETWQSQRTASRFHSLLEQMAHESYAAYAREVAQKHLLPDNFSVNYSTGVVTPVVEED